MSEISGFRTPVGAYRNADTARDDYSESGDRSGRRGFESGEKMIRNQHHHSQIPIKQGPDVSYEHYRKNLIPYKKNQEKLIIYSKPKQITGEGETDERVKDLISPEKEVEKAKEERKPIQMTQEERTEKKMLVRKMLENKFKNAYESPSKSQISQLSPERTEQISPPQPMHRELRSKTPPPVARLLDLHRTPSPEKDKMRSPYREHIDSLEDSPVVLPQTTEPGLQVPIKGEEIKQHELEHLRRGLSPQNQNQNQQTLHDEQEEVQSMASKSVKSVKSKCSKCSGCQPGMQYLCCNCINLRLINQKKYNKLVDQSKERNENRKIMQQQPLWRQVIF
jgi:hypothetical protein